MVTLIGGSAITIAQAYELIPPRRFARYNGLLTDPAGVPAGMVTGSIDRLGGFSLKLQLPGGNYTLTGVLDANGGFAGEIKRPGHAPVSITLQLDNADSYLSATIRVDGETLDVASARAVFSAKNSSPATGRHTLVLPADTSQTDHWAYPCGYGYGLLKVNESGKVRAIGQLGDGQPFSVGGVIGGDYRWAVYTRPYRERGLLGGTLTFVAPASAATNQIDGVLTWQKPASSDKAYPAGFEGSTIVQGSRYTPPASGAAALDIDNWTLMLGANVFTDPITAFATLDARNRFILTGSTSPKTSLTLAPATGLLAGRFGLDGVGSVAFKGVLLLEQRVGRGTMSLPGRTGPFTLDPPQVP